MIKNICLLMLLLSGFQGRARQGGEQPVARPEIIAHFPEMPHVLTLPDGKLMALFIRYEGPGLPAAEDSQVVRARYSTDNGDTWSDEVPLFTLPRDAGGFGYYVTLLDQQGEIHIFMLNDRRTGAILPLPGGKNAPPSIQNPLDIWHVKSKGHRTGWEAPAAIWRGRAGDLQSVIQCTNGRIILPFSYLTDRSWSHRGTGADRFTYYGRFNSGVLYSDDGGHSWLTSPDTLKTPVSNLSALGAIEPVVIQLRDGRIWMLLRTQTGHFYESFSSDGSRWSAPAPSSIASSDSPAGLLRLTDGRLLLMVNDCRRFPYALGGRHVLQAAISADEGRTWTYRELVRDPQQAFGPPPGGDNGVSYPYLTQARDGRVVYSLWVDGTQTGRNLYRFDPAWLMESSQQEDFVDSLSGWSVFGTRGAGLASTAAGKKVLWLHKASEPWPSAAVLNFPSGARGSLKLRFMLQKGFSGADIGLTDHFSVPFDDLANFHNLLNVKISKDGILAGTTTRLDSLRWYVLTLTWDCGKGSCHILLDDRLIGVKSLQRQSAFVNYLRLRSTAGQPDKGMWISMVQTHADRQP